jgi:hypothetical protein
MADGVTVSVEKAAADRASARMIWRVGVTAGLLVILVGLVWAAAWWAGRSMEERFEGTVESVATASLQSLHEQARLVPFVARFVAVTTSEQQRFGFSAKQTMIMPGMVRYELDLAALRQRDVTWDEAAKTLTVTLPPLQIAGPEIDLKALQVYDGGGILMALTDAEKTLDTANRTRGQAELITQARADAPMRLARNSAKNAIERSFAMPLRAAGLEAHVVARFADEGAAGAPAAGTQGE